MDSASPSRVFPHVSESRLLEVYENAIDAVGFYADMHDFALLARSTIKDASIAELLNRAMPSWLRMWDDLNQGFSWRRSMDVLLAVERGNAGQKTTCKLRTSTFATAHELALTLFNFEVCLARRYYTDAHRARDPQLLELAAKLKPRSEDFKVDEICAQLSWEWRQAAAWLERYRHGTDGAALADDLPRHQEKPIAKSPSGRVLLFQRDEKPCVDGIRMPVLTAAKYRAVNACLVAGSDGLSKTQLDMRCGGGADNYKHLAALKKLAHWQDVIVLPGKAGQGGYRIL